MSFLKKIIFLSFLICVFFSQVVAQITTLGWVKKLAGTSYVGGTSITLDKSGNVYTVGYFAGTADFDPGPGVCNLVYGGNQNVFISKLDVSGNFVWAKNIGGSAGGSAFSIITDTLGNVYVSGHFSGTVDFDPNSGAVNLTSNGGTDIFLLKLDSFGNFVWVKQFGGTTNDLSPRITFDKTGNLYVTGVFTGTVDFDSSVGVSNLTDYGSGDVFVLKLDVLGNFVWVKQIGGIDTDASSAIDTDDLGNIYTTGIFYGSGDYDPGPSTYYLYAAGNSDGFISKLDSTGNFVWAKSIGGNWPDYPLSLKLDSVCNVYITGRFLGTADFDPGPATVYLSSDYNDDIFIMKLDSTGNYAWAGVMGGISIDAGNSLDLDKSGNVYVTGFFRDTVDFDPGVGVYNLMAVTAFGPSDDVFILKLDASGNFIWVQHIGSSASTEIANSITLDDNGNIYTTGYFGGTSDFDPGPGVFNVASGSSTSSFVHKMILSNVGILEIENKNRLVIYPNPTNGSLTIHSKTELQNIEVVAITGQVLLSETPTNVAHTLHLDNFANGIYFVNLYQNNRIVKREKVVLNK